MKQGLAGIIILLCLGTFSWGQGTKESFDAKKSSEELEIMRGILNTTLTFFVQNSQKQPAQWRSFDLDSFYLAGQGAVFVIPTSGLRSPGMNFAFHWDPEYSEQMASLGQEIGALSSRLGAEAAKSALQSLAQSGFSQDEEVVPEPPAPPAAPAAPSKPAKPEKPKAPAQIDREKLRKTLEDYQARAQKNREDAKANREKFLQTLGEAKQYLVETLANYGDSLTTVKPDEYVNLVLVTDALDGQRKRSDVISARKSWITDYKAGRLTLESFKQKAIQYSE